MPKAKTSTETLESSLKQLETIVEQMGGADLPLEKALEQFEKGVGCIKSCQELLKNAEQRIEVLTRDPE